MEDSDHRSDERGSQNLREKGEETKNNFLERRWFFLKSNLNNKFLCVCSFKFNNKIFRCHFNFTTSTLRLFFSILTLLVIFCWAWASMLRTLIRRTSSVVR